MFVAARPRPVNRLQFRRCLEQEAESFPRRSLTVYGWDPRRHQSNMRLVKPRLTEDQSMPRQRQWVFVDDRSTRRSLVWTIGRQLVLAAVGTALWWAPPSRKRATPGLVGPLRAYGAEAPMSARARIRRAKLDLQNIDENLIELMIANRGTAEGVRRELTRVMKELGQLPALARQLLEEEPDVDFDALQPYIDELGVKLPLAISWSSEADECQNGSCAAQEVDEARENYLDATELLVKIEQLL
mmetsp:Transcript_13864/g.25481  ORF Transcript_13864/g.25481 Transcript_13864/m.25481 type:complete len:243 (+) Transcript_13864:45-773(+)